MPKIITSDMFINNATAYWGCRYDYSLVAANWKNSTTKIPIKCNKCNNIWNILPSNHCSMTSHQGCKKCNVFKPEKMKLTEFINRAINIHGNKFDYSNITNWNGANNKITIKCNICNNHITIRAKNHIATTPTGCIHCQPTIVGNKLKLSYDEFASRFYKNKDPNIYKIESYNRGRENVIIKCMNCNELKSIRPDHALTQRKLCACSYKWKLSTSDFIQKATIKHDGLYKYENTIYNGYRNKTIITCNTHGDFELTPEAHMMGTGCQKCQSSKGELKVAFALDNINMSYIKEKYFHDCRYKNPLPFDFYLPSLNTCIEYNGEQHYKPVRFKGLSIQKSIDNFKFQCIKDKLKSQYCKDNNIKLLIIPYWDYNNIPIIIESFVKTHQSLQ